MKVRDAIKLVETDGWKLVRTRGSHRQYRHPVKPGTVTIAGHPSVDLGAKNRSLYLSKQVSKMSKYTVFFERTETGYSAYVPDLPGCVAAASTLEETRELMRGAIAFHIEELRLHGYPVPEPTPHVEEIEVSA